MAVEARHVVFYGSANMQETDDGTPQGGAVDTSVKVTFADMKVTASVLAYSDSASDTAVSVVVTGRDGSGALIANTKLLTGLTKAVIATTYERLLKATKSAGSTYVGNITIVQGATASLSGTAQSGGTTWIQLASGAITSNNQYKGKVLITDDNNFGEIVKTTSADDKAYIRFASAWGTEPTGSTTYEIRAGVVFEKTLGYSGSADEINTVRRPFYNAASDPSNSATFYEKIFVSNTNGTLTLSSSTLTEVATGMYDKVSFALATGLDDTYSCDDRRNVAASLPSNITAFFDDTDGAQSFPNSQNFTYSAGLGVWLRLALTSGAAAQNSFYELQVNGQTT